MKAIILLLSLLAQPQDMPQLEKVPPQEKKMNTHEIFFPSEKFFYRQDKFGKWWRDQDKARLENHVTQVNGLEWSRFSGVDSEGRTWKDGILQPATRRYAEGRDTYGRAWRGRTQGELEAPLRQANQPQPRTYVEYAWPAQVLPPSTVCTGSSCNIR